MKQKYTKDDLIELLRGHKEHITSISNWNQYRADKSLPHAQTIISHFGSWNAFKDVLNLEKNQQNRPQKYSDEELLSILEKHKEQYSSVAAWDQFAENNNLPKHFIFLDRVGPDVLFEKVGYVSKWTHDNIKSAILSQFPDSPPTQAEWHAITKVFKNLPGYMTIIRQYGGWNQMKEKLYSSDTLS